MCVQRSRYIEIKRRKKNSGVGALSFHNTFFLWSLSTFTNRLINLSVCASSDLQAREEVEVGVP